MTHALPRIARTLIAAFAVVAPTLHADADIELGAAPQRFESQDTSGWIVRAEPKAGATRADVVALYQTLFVPGNGVALAWSGTISPCAPGTTNIEHQNAVIARVNYHRRLVGLPDVTLAPGTPVTQAQAAALMMSANNALNHMPPTTWTCYSADGNTGAMNSNLTLGAMGVAAIVGYMDDPGPGNTAVGHRRWILHPPRASMSTGDVPGGNTPPRPANALHVFGAQTTRPATPDGIAWPPAGFVPYQNLPVRSNRWSFSYPGANFASAQVTMSGPGGNVPLTYEALATGFGDNTLVWLPTGVSYAQPSADTTYNVTVSGVSGAGVPASFSYSVTIIDPDAAPPPPPPAPTTALAIEYYNASLDHYFITYVAAEIANLDSGRTVGWTRTGESFRVYTSAGAGTSPVCRFYIPPGKGDSHFYGRGTTECTNTGDANPDFFNEDPQFFHVVLPVAGVCPAGTTAVYRVFSNRADANHRYMVLRSLRDFMATRGWTIEGDGVDFVVMCVPPALNP
jgi:hypothetical protein